MIMKHNESMSALHRELFVSISAAVVYTSSGVPKAHRTSVGAQKRHCFTYIEASALVKMVLDSFWLSEVNTGLAAAIYSVAYGW
jgi:hypothetical protein